MTTTMTFWKQYEPMIQALVALFNPFMEVAVHDLKEGKIVALYNNLSGRSVGESSPLAELKIPTEGFPDFFSPYYKSNWDGKPLKCTSITIRDVKKVPIGLICLNVDTSFAKEAERVLQLFLKTETSAENPIEMFGGQCEEQARMLIDEFLKKHQTSLTNLKRGEKRLLINFLHEKGILNYKNSVPFLARYLNLSRASIYNYIKGEQ